MLGHRSGGLKDASLKPLPGRAIKFQWFDEGQFPTRGRIRFNLVSVILFPFLPSVYAVPTCAVVLRHMEEEVAAIVVQVPSPLFRPNLQALFLFHSQQGAECNQFKQVHSMRAPL